jgi:hypothetical protein
MDVNMIRVPKIKDGVLRPATNSDLIKLENGVVTTKKIELITRFLPLLDSETLLFAQDSAQDLKSLLEPVRDSCMRDSMSQDELETCLAVKNWCFVVDFAS